MQWLLLSVHVTRVSDGVKILFTQADLNQEIITITNGELYTEEQMNLMLTEILDWGDVDGDGQIGLEEAINALRIVTGVTAPAGTE